jgi:hypothetical protein
MLLYLHKLETNRVPRAIINILISNASRPSLYIEPSKNIQILNSLKILAIILNAMVILEALKKIHEKLINMNTIIIFNNLSLNNSLLILSFLFV